jgi:hypothetical protein
MKTTIEIPDSIFRRAKSVAAERGIPLRALITEALADRLRAENGKGQALDGCFRKAPESARGNGEDQPHH